jgi:hypothetical protein
VAKQRSPTPTTKHFLNARKIHKSNFEISGRETRES